MLSLDASSLSIQKFYAGDPNIPNGWQTLSRFDLSPLFGGSLIADAIATNTAPHVTHVSKSIFEQDLHVKGNLSCDGTTPSPFWIAGNIDAAGAIFKQKGKYVFYCTKVSPMIFDITFPSHPDGDRYTVCLSSTEYHVLYRTETPTSFRIYAANNSNAFTQQGGGVVSVAILI